MAFDPLEYLKKNRDIEQESVFDPTAYLSKNSPQDIPTDEEFGEIKGYQEPTRELSLTQKAINKAGELMSGGGLKAYSEYATPEDIEYEKQSKLLASGEAVKGIGGDLLAATSAGVGTGLDYILDGVVDKPFGQRMGESVFRPELSEKAQNYKDKFLENLQALGPFSGPLGNLQRLTPVQGMPSVTRQLPIINKAVETTAKGIAQGEKVASKGIDLTKAAAANVYNKINFKGNEKIANYLMKSALKPTIAQHQSGASQNAVNYMLKNGINPTEGGVKFIERDLTRLNKQVDDLISANKNKTIRKSHIFDNLDDAREKFALQVDNAADLKAFDGVIDRFKARFKGRTIDTKLAHEMKKNTYRQINKKYGEMKSAEVEAQKQIARLLKEEVERLTSKNGINQVRDLNKQIAEAVDTLDVVTRRSFMDSNKNPFGGLSLLAHSTEVAAIQHFQSIGIPKSQIARMFNYIAKEAPVSSTIKNLAKPPYRAGKQVINASSEADTLRLLGLLGRDQE